jgi:hypothetical protein
MTKVPITDLVDELDAASFLHCSVKTLQGRRLRKQPPKYYKIGPRVKYSVADLQAYLDSCAVSPETP